MQLTSSDSLSSFNLSTEVLTELNPLVVRLPASLLQSIYLKP
jgi:hypothetical protein